MSFDGIGQRVHDRYEARRVAFGTDVLRMADGLVYRCVIQVLAPEAVDVLQLETGQNATDRNALVLHLPPDCPVAVGDFLLVPATGSPASCRFRVVSMAPPPIVQNVVGRLQAVCFFTPDLS